jgi:hypothetical protein
MLPFTPRKLVTASVEVFGITLSDTDACNAILCWLLRVIRVGGGTAVAAAVVSEVTVAAALPLIAAALAKSTGA